MEYQWPLHFFKKIKTMTTYWFAFKDEIFDMVDFSVDRPYTIEMQPMVTIS